MGWLIELLVESIKEKCSQFIVDMMELITNMFTELLSCDLDLFEELFGVVGDLYKNVIVPLAIALLLMICVWQLFKSMFGRMGMNSEDPIELVCRSGACLFMIVGAKTVVNYILGIAGTPYQWVVGTAIEVDSFSEYVSALEGVTAALGIDSISVMLLMLIMQFVVAWNYLKMLFIIAERYVLLGVFSYTAPLAFATGGSKATNNILASWVKMFGGQIVLIIMNAWCMKMFLSGYGNMLASGYGFTKFFVATLCLIGFCKVTFKLDSYMASLGVNLGRPTNGLGAMGLFMAASRLFGRGGHGGSGKMAEGAASEGSAGADPSAGMVTPDASQSMGTPVIPMSMDMADGADGNLDADASNAADEAAFGDDMEAQAEAMDELENDNVLEALGEMPEDGDMENLAFDEDEAMELAGSDGLNHMPEGEDADFFNEEGGIDGLGDYPVNREEDTEEEEMEASGEMDLEGTIPTEDGGTGEATCGSAGSAFEETASFSSGGHGGRGYGGESGGDILEELGGGMTAAPTDLQGGDVSGIGGDLLETASGGMGSVAERGDSSAKAQDEGQEARFFESSASGSVSQPQDGLGSPMTGAENQNYLAGENGTIPERNETASNGRMGNSYGEIPDVPKSRRELENNRKQPPGGQDDLL